jgi:hypothetical protein
MKKSLFTLGLIATGLFATAQTRMVLFEEFTGENCGPCASTNPALNTTLNNNASKVIALKWQVPIPSAPSATWSLYKTNQAEIDWRYKASGYNYPSQNTATNSITNGINSAPSGRLDGQHQWAFGATSDHPFYISSSVLTTAQSATTNFAIQMDQAYDPTFSNAVVTVTVTSSTTFTSNGALMFRLCLVERSITFPSAPGSNGETHFEDVVRKSYPTVTSGTAVTGMGTAMIGTWTAGQSQTYTINAAIPSYINDKSQMAFVGFIQDDGNKKIYQSYRTSTPSIPNDVKLNSILANMVNCANHNPTITVVNQGTTAITDLTVTPYVDGVAQTTFTWNGNLAGLATATIPLGSYASTNGAHTFSATITGVSGGDVNTANNTGKSVFGVSSTTTTSPVMQPFATFPPANWYFLNPDFGTATWSLGNTNGFGGAGTSAKYDFYNNGTVGDADHLFFPVVNLTGISNPNLSFDVAHASYTSGNPENDKLDVMVSLDCGATWTNVYSKQGTVLNTANPTTGNFVPTSTQWRNEIVSLPTAANQASVLLKFVATSDYGNNMYIDNVNLGAAVSIAKHNENLVSFEVYPNPANTSATMKAYSAFDQAGTVMVYNTLGQVVKTTAVSLNFGINEITLNTNELANGVYNVVLNTETGSVTKKLTVSK